MAWHGRPIDFAPYVVGEETKTSNGNKKMTLQEFAKCVHSKQDLLYALGVKGKARSPLH